MFILWDFNQNDYKTGTWCLFEKKALCENLNLIFGGLIWSVGVAFPFNNNQNDFFLFVWEQEIGFIIILTNLFCFEFLKGPSTFHLFLKKDLEFSYIIKLEIPFLRYIIKSQKRKSLCLSTATIKNVQKSIEREGNRKFRLFVDVVNLMNSNISHTSTNKTIEKSNLDWIICIFQTTLLTFR